MYPVQKDMSSRPKDFLPRLACMVTLDPWIEWLAIRSVSIFTNNSDMLFSQVFHQMTIVTDLHRYAALQNALADSALLQRLLRFE